MAFENQGISRRDFLHAGAGAAATAVVMTAVPNCTPTALAVEGETGDEERVTEELSVPEMDAPEVTAYESDVLVIGGGFAGLNAAMAAAESGVSVVLVDKGTPGYAGLSPWAGTHAWFDPDYDDYDACRESIIRGGEFMNNQTWLDIWLNESKDTYERLLDWGLLDRYDRASDAGDYWADNNYVGYQEDIIADHDRHARYMTLLEEAGVTVVTHTMITKVVVEDDKTRGAIGFYVPSATVMKFDAKAVVMCMGQGSFRVQGWPAAADTFDGERICYELGLPICNKETEDYHSTQSTHPGTVFLSVAWSYLENFFFCPISGVDADDLNAYGRTQCRFLYYSPNYKEGVPIAAYTHSAGKAVEENENGDIRTGKAVDGNWEDNSSRTYRIGGASPGFCGHLMPGVHCDWDDTEGFTGIEGLYVAGDGMNASAPNGFGYGNIHGLTSNFCSTQGYHAGNAAAAYAEGVELTPISDDAYATEEERILEPLLRSQEEDVMGMDPSWCFNTLANIMTPYFVMNEKTDEMLESALHYVEHLRDETLPRLIATNGHDLRLYHECESKVLSAEMKLRAGLARKESRGFCYHADYQYRDDENFLCLIGCVKQEDGTMGIETFELPDEWKGDLDEDYNTRYPNTWPDEEAQLKEVFGWDITRPEPELSV